MSLVAQIMLRWIWSAVAVAVAVLSFILVCIGKNECGVLSEWFQYQVAKKEFEHKLLIYFEGLQDGNPIESIEIDGWELAYICDDCSGGNYAPPKSNCGLSESQPDFTLPRREPEPFSKSAWVFVKGCVPPMVLNGDRRLPYLWDAPFIDISNRNEKSAHYCIRSKEAHKDIRNRLDVRIIEECESKTSN